MSFSILTFRLRLEAFCSPEPIWLFSNFSFANVKRALDQISAPRHPNFACPVTHLSHLMSAGPTQPPGLRFPTGAVVGHHLIIAGTFLAQQNSSFAIWALDLSQAPRGGKLAWQKIDPGSIMGDCASWTKAFVWRNTVVVLGDRDREITADYDHRQLNWTHCAFVDLEAFGIYQPPLQLLSPSLQQAGLDWLSMTGGQDFEIVAADGNRFGCSRRILPRKMALVSRRDGPFHCQGLKSCFRSICCRVGRSYSQWKSANADSQTATHTRLA